MIMKTGFVNINKPSGEYSSASVNKLKKLTHTPCGHMGTLDPLANGVLPVGIGNSTRLFDYFLSKKKTYIAQFYFGVNSDTLDVEGKIERGGAIPTKEQIEEVLSSLTGEVMQVPPKYSAKLVNGKRGYDLARAGKDFELQAKKVVIDGIKLLSQDEENKFSFEIECGGGTYIRSIARDMGEKLGTQAIMSKLQRTKSGFFTLDTAVEPSLLTEENIDSFIIPTEDVIPFPVIKIRNFHIFHGLEVKCNEEDGLYKIYDGNGFYGVVEVKDGSAKMKIKLC